MTVKEIVKKYLIEHGYDGLYSSGECACKLDDFMPCGCEGIELCEAGYLQEPDSELKKEGWDYYIGPKSKNIKADGGLDETVVNCVSDDGDRYNRLDVDWERMEQIVHDIVPYLGREDIKGNVRALLQLKARIDELFSMMEGHAENVHGDWNKDRLDWLAKTLGLDYASRAEKKAEDEGLIPKEESDGKR